jgi:hypothetical protein
VRLEVCCRALLPGRSCVLLAVSHGENFRPHALDLRRIQVRAVPLSFLGIAHADHGRPGDKGCAGLMAAHADRFALSRRVLKTSDLGTCLSEGAGREFRHSALREIATSEDSRHVVVGHTQPDLAEMLLYESLHGANADDLSTLTWIRDMHRTAGDVLVEAENERIKSTLSTFIRVAARYCGHVSSVRCECAKGPVHSRLALLARCHTREHVLPYSRSFYDGQVEEASARTAQVLQEESYAMESSAADVW